VENENLDVQKDPYNVDVFCHYNDLIFSIKRKKRNSKENSIKFKKQTTSSNLTSRGLP